NRCRYVDIPVATITLIDPGYVPITTRYDAQPLFTVDGNPAGTECLDHDALLSRQEGAEDTTSKLYADCEGWIVHMPGIGQFEMGVTLVGFAPKEVLMDVHEDPDRSASCDRPISHPEFLTITMTPQ